MPIASPHPYVSPRAARRPGFFSRAMKFRRLVTLALLGFLAFWILLSRTGSAVVAPADLRVTVQPGQTFGALPRWFPQRPFPVGGFWYRAWIFAFLRDRKLQAGDYVLPQGTTLEKMVATLSANPETRDVKATLLPGWNLADYDAALAKAGLSRPGELLSRDGALAAKFAQKYHFLKDVRTLEGLLAPDTYSFDPDGGLDAAVDRMLGAFQKSAPDGFFGREDWYASLTMASIVEKEERNPAEQPTVAGVLWKRLRTAPAFLGADATVCYQKLLPQGECQAFVNAYYAKPRAERDALGYAYDTRGRVGLPPTPISSVRPDTLRATLAPKESPYWFYLHDSSGRARYAETIEGHGENKRKYLY